MKNKSNSSKSSMKIVDCVYLINKIAREMWIVVRTANGMNKVNASIGIH